MTENPIASEPRQEPNHFKFILGIGLLGLITLACAAAEPAVIRATQIATECPPGAMALGEGVTFGFSLFENLPSGLQQRIDTAMTFVLDSYRILEVYFPKIFEPLEATLQGVQEIIYAHGNQAASVENTLNGQPLPGSWETLWSHPLKTEPAITTIDGAANFTTTVTAITPGGDVLEVAKIAYKNGCTFVNALPPFEDGASPYVPFPPTFSPAQSP